MELLRQQGEGDTVIGVVLIQKIPDNLTYPFFGLGTLLVQVVQQAKGQIVKVLLHGVQRLELQEGGRSLPADPGKYF